MNKRADLSPITKFILAIIVFLALVWFLTGNRLHAWEIIKDQVKVPGTEDQAAGQSLDFGTMKEPLKKLTDAMAYARDSQTAKGCIVDLAAFPSDFDDYQIFVQRFSGGTDIYLKKGEIKRRFSTVDNVYPCAVYGNDPSSGEPIAKNFYSNWLSGTRCPSCKKDFNEFSEMIIPKKDDITIDGTKLSREDILYLYKAGPRDVCFFVTYSGSIFGRCSGAQDGLDNDCLDEIAASVPACAAPATTTTTNTLGNACEEYSNSHGGGFSCRDIAQCGFTRDAPGLSQCDASPAKCARQKCPGDIYNVCCKG